MRRAAKVDATQAAIVQALRDAGCKVLSLAAMGKGAADLLVLPPRVYRIIAPQFRPQEEGYCEDCARPTLPYLLEVKNPAGRGTSLTPDQVKFHAEWPVTVVTTPEEALRAVGL